MGYYEDYGKPAEQALAALKFDNGKPRWDLVPWDVLEDVVMVLNYGAGKYEDRNWEKGMKWSRMFAAAIRHIIRHFFFREYLDPESGKPHLSHAICCLMFLDAYAKRNVGEDDRPGGGDNEDD
jgi:hypothetical protein